MEEEGVHHPEAVKTYAATQPRRTRMLIRFSSAAYVLSRSRPSSGPWHTSQRPKVFLQLIQRQHTIQHKLCVKFAAPVHRATAATHIHPVRIGPA
ncbi:hypothetical protein Y032_0114g455 [Ancylostoma ceylanicum]|uniref:Uncharacterized protein n=1 Tax=Ancylostoma ceylanicum TaxID=53326 RepID=A0A016TCH6_9BILA|nr:hypothetical protein Y032_0114g455 [Ancylostoma ceylanicum]